MADTELPDLTELSVPAGDDIIYIVDDPAGTPLDRKISLNRLLGMLGFIPGGRLTLTTGVPVTTSDVTGAGTLYYTPYKHNRLRVYDGTRWKWYTFSELSLALSLTSGKPYDIFVYDNAGTLTLEALVWTNDTTRATALAMQDGVYVKSGATTRLYLGTIYASGTNTTEDSKAKRLVWNAYNRVPRKLQKYTAAVTYDYGTAAWRAANADSAFRVAVVSGLASESVVDLTYLSGVNSVTTSTYGYSGIGVNTSTADNSDANGRSGWGGTGITGNAAIIQARLVYIKPAGHDYFQATEYVDGGSNVTFYGDFGDGRLKTGLFGTVSA
jgi:hypothetical protein